MKILFLTYDFPYPMTSGGKNRAYHMIKYGKLNDEIILLSFNRNTITDDQTQVLRNIGVKKIITFKRKSLKSPQFIIRTILEPKKSVFYNLYFDKSISRYLKSFIEKENIDLVHFESFYTAFYISSFIQKMNVKQVFGTENIEHLLYAEYVKNIKNNITKIPYSYMAKKVKMEEEQYLKLADASLAVTSEEEKYIKRVSDKPTYVIENGIDIKNFSINFKRKLVKKINLLFVGNFSYFPNVDAMRRFNLLILPKLPSNIHTTIIGKKVNKISFINDERVTKVEYVENILAEYHKADIFIFPVTIGGGTNFKILEAMAAGLPIIANPDRVKGLGVVDKKHLLFAETENEFISAISTLINENILRLNIIREARRLVEEKYAWEEIGKRLNKAWHEVAGK